MGEERGNILEVRGLKVWFPVRRGVLGLARGYVKAVDGVSFSLRRGGALGLLGESGCGKSTTARAILGLVAAREGEILVGGGRVAGPAPRLRAKERARRVQAVFQDPLASLNPRHTVFEILTEGMLYHGLCTASDARDRAAELLGDVGISGDALERYPHEFSGGQRQRICIARAMALEPDLLVCDEAVSSLDLSVRAQTLDLIASLRERRGLAVLFITHDIGAARRVAESVVVMNKGRIVESGSCEEVLCSPREEYTKALLEAAPAIGKPLA